VTGTAPVIGGTGQLGAPVVEQLRGDGYRVRLLARRLPALTTATPSWSMSRATWTTPTRCETTFGLSSRLGGTSLGKRRME
jgi:nucleoside-diphosphate-sugar epimerase